MPGRILEIDDGAALHTGAVDFGGTRRDVCLAYLPEAQVGDHVIVHAGFALCVIDEVEAARTLALLEEVAALDSDR